MMNAPGPRRRSPGDLRRAMRRAGAFLGETMWPLLEDRGTLLVVVATAFLVGGVAWWGSMMFGALLGGAVTLLAVALGANAKPVIVEPLLTMMPIPAGTFMMGSPDDDPTAFDSEKPARRVGLEGFTMAKVPTTRGQWRSVMKGAPGQWSGGDDDLPATHILFRQTLEFCNALSTRELLRPCYDIGADKITWHLEADGYRLPTEEEWEYACRAKTKTRYWSGDSEEDVDKVGWFAKNSNGRIHAVGEKPGNAWGLHDVHGNVWEWCWDVWQDRRYDHPPDNVSQNLTTLSLRLSESVADAPRVVRGGSCRVGARLLRSAIRFGIGDRYRNDFLGFRCVRSPRRQHVVP